MEDAALKARLDAEAARRNHPGEVCRERPDPVLVARRECDEYAALVCALFGYGRAESIVAFLERLDFSLLDASEARIERELQSCYYRFQNGSDVTAFFIALRRLRLEGTLEARFKEGYDRSGSVLEGVNALIAAIRGACSRESRGYTFLIGSEVLRPRGGSPLKRWMMYLRWMVRRDAIDMGLWSGVRRSDLIIPLDTHTFHVSRTLGLLQRRSYDLQAAVELTERLRTFDPQDPVRYDFALYRLGQEKLLTPFSD